MELRSTAPTTIAGMFALAAFLIAVVAGLAGSVDHTSILVRAIMAMLCCYPVGLLAGSIALKVVNEHIERHREENPAPDSTAELRDVLPDSAFAETEDGEEVLVV